MSSNNVYPRSRKEDERLIVRSQTNFDGGMITDLEPTEIPNNAVAHLNNARGHLKSIKGRKGTSPFLGGELPSLTDALAPTLSGTVMAVSTDYFEEWMVGYKISSSDRAYSFIITEVTDAKTVSVAFKTGAPEQLYTNASVRGPLNAIYVDRETDIVYYLIGRDVYARDVATAVWEQYTCTASDFPASMRSYFTKVQDYVTLFNGSGIFVLNKYENQHYFWSANDSIPEYKINFSIDSDILIDPSAYLYAYTYSKIRGNYFKNRNDRTTFIECETAPYFHAEDDPTEDVVITGEPNQTYDGRNSDLTANYLNTPIEKSKYQWLTFNDSYKNFESWVKLSDDGEKPFLNVTVGTSTPVVVYFDFSLCENMNDVVEVFNVAFNSDLGHDVHAKLSDTRSGMDGFIVYDKDPNSNVVFTADVVSDGYCLIDNSILTVQGIYVTMGNPVNYLRYPSNRKDITHYSVYRSNDVYAQLKGGNVTEESTFLSGDVNNIGWIDDAPACKLFYGTVSSGIFTETDSSGTALTKETGRLKFEDAFNQISVLNPDDTIDTFNLTDYIFEGSTNTFKCDSSDIATVKPMYFGARSLIKGSLGSDGVITVTNGFEFDSTEYTGDVGKVIFWEDGDISTIKDVTGVVATTLDTIAKSERYALMNPSYRSYYDGVNDNKRKGQISSWPLRTRYYTQMPYSNLAVYNNGIIIEAITDKGEVYYSDALELRSMGYHHENNQTIKSIEEGIRTVFIVNNMFTICTVLNTYTINQSQGIVQEDDDGGYWVALPSPTIAKHGIGTARQYCVTDGPDGTKLVYTNEPAIRTFNGFEYGENLAKDKIMSKGLQKMSYNVILDYDKVSGIHIWGKEA